MGVAQQILAAGGANSLPIPSGTQVLWHLDEGTGTSGPLVDSSGNGYTQAFTGFTSGNGLITSDGKFGAGCVQSNYGGYCEASGSANLNIGTSDDFTVACWLKSTSSTASLLFNWDPASYLSGGFLYMNYPSTGYATLYGPGGGSSILVSAPSTGLYDGAWHHLAITRSGGTNRLFVDGVVKATNSAAVSLGTQNKFAVGGTTVPTIIAKWDEVIFVKGTALWTAGFTPPTVPYG